MTTIWAGWTLAAATAAAFIMAAVGDLVSEEIRGQLDRLPHALIHLAAGRAPVDVRAELQAEWAAELHEILRGAEAMPITRLMQGTRFAVGLVRTAKDIGRQLGNGVDERDAESSPEPAVPAVSAKPQPAGGFWNDLDKAERDALLEAARPRRYSPGQPLSYQGDPSDHIIVIENGWAKVTLSTEDGHEVVLAIRGPGELICESAILGSRPHSVTITALGSLRALLVPAGRFTAFLDEHPRVWRIVSGILVRRNDDDARRLGNQASADGARRLALLMVHLTQWYGVARPDGSVMILPPLSQEELASWIDSSRETVARALKVWRAQGLVDTARRKIIVLRPEDLRAYAGQ